MKNTTFSAPAAFRPRGLRAPAGLLGPLRQTSSVLVAVLLASLCVGLGQDLTVTVSPPTQTARRGDLVTIQGAIHNSGPAPVFLNGNSISLFLHGFQILPSAFDLVLDDQPFAKGVPVKLDPGEEWSGRLFEISIGIDVPTTTYDGSFAVLGGTTAVPFIAQGNAAFQLAVLGVPSVDGPAVPIDLTATSGGSTITLAWTDQASDEEGFSIEQSTDGSAYSVIGQVGTDRDHYVVGPLDNPADAYFFRIRAFNSFQTLTYSAFSSVVSVPTYRLALAQTGQGTVQAAPRTERYLSNAVVSLTATAEAGLAFTGWSGDATGTNNPLNVIVRSNMSVRATFLKLLSFTALTPGGGSVGVTPSAGAYPSGASLTVGANPAPGWVFLHWLGDLNNTNQTNTVTMTRAKSVTAIFGTPFTPSITGNGSVGIAPLAAFYPYGESVQLTAVPAAGHFFSSWSDQVLATDNPVSFVITHDNALVTATFAPLVEGEFALTVIVDGHGGVTANPKGNHFVAGTVVQLAALPDTGESFLGWSGDANGMDHQLAVTLNQSRTIVARFTQRPKLFIDLGDLFLGTDGSRVTVRGEAGQVLEIQTRPTLTEGWTPLGLITNDFGETQFLDPTATNGTVRFYRARVTP